MFGWRKPHREWSERHEIIRALIAETNPRSVESFRLDLAELGYYRARSARAIDDLTKNTSSFSAYYKLPTEKPFSLVLAISALVIFGAIAAGVYVYLKTLGNPAYPIYAALISLSVIAAGWAVNGWFAHRNAIRQNTNNLLFARFAQAPFGDALFRFHRAFKAPMERVTGDKLAALRISDCDDDMKAAAAVTYLLNYFEFIAVGVLRGDFDEQIVRENLRGVIIYFHDKCEPYIADAKRRNPKIFENLTKLRASYQDT